MTRDSPNMLICRCKSDGHLVAKCPLPATQADK